MKNTTSLGLTRQLICLSENWMPYTFDTKRSNWNDSPSNHAELGTVINNMMAQGFLPSKSVMSTLMTLDATELAQFWKSIKTALKHAKADDVDMGAHVVYQNFPKEVLEMSQAEYWIKQILMYLGFDKEFFRQDAIERDPCFNDRRFIVLHPMPEDGMAILWDKTIAKPTQWIDLERHWVQQEFERMEHVSLNFSEFGFKANALMMLYTLAKSDWDQCKLEALPALHIKDAVDVLRIAAMLACKEAPETALRGKLRFASSYRRPQARYLLTLLDQSAHLEQDVANRQKDFKHLLSRLHVSRFGSDQVKHVYDLLYKGELMSDGAKIERSLAEGNTTGLVSLLNQKPGVFMRKLNELWMRTEDDNLIVAFADCLPQLTTLQLTKLKALLIKQTMNTKRIVAPKGLWTRAQVLDNPPMLNEGHRKRLVNAINTLLAERLSAAFPQGLSVDRTLENVKLPSNHQKLAPYGQGTRFSIPDNIKVIRSASYWEQKNRGTMWADNGWLFFDERMRPMTACCWNVDRPEKNGKPLAVFSGDPVIDGSKGNHKACQMIDLDINNLVDAGIRYAFWNILSYNHIPFDDIDDVRGTLQLAEDPMKGKLYEPSRAQLAFKPTGKGMASYLAYIDLKTREIVYMDANLYGKVMSARENLNKDTAEKLSALMDTFEAAPSLYDLLAPAHQDADEAIACVYRDEAPVTADSAYIFRPESQNTQVDNLLSIHDFLK